jgi:hypothetical protein
MEFSVAGLNVEARMVACEELDLPLRQCVKLTNAMAAIGSAGGQFGLLWSIEQEHAV